ncbi:MAG: hypothetical protein ACRBBN_17835 [Methyloligellaceae bacterium]
MQKKLLPISIFTALLLSSYGTYASSPQWKVEHDKAVIEGASQWKLDISCQNFVTVGLVGKSNIGAFGIVKGPMTFTIDGNAITANASGHHKGAHIGTGGTPENDNQIYTIIKKLISGAKEVTVTYDTRKTAEDKTDQVLWKATYSLNGAASAIKTVIKKCNNVNTHFKF